MATAVQKLSGEANRRQVVRLRLAGHTLESIAEQLGMTESGVRYHQDAWLAAQKPTTEQTEELRQIQSAQLDALHAKLEPRLEDPDEYLAVTDRLVKLMDRKARLMGLDLQAQPGVTLNVTAEALAQVFGYDAALAIEGTAEEITSGDESA